MTQLHPHVSDHLVLEAMENAIRLLSQKFSFGIFTAEDMAQEGRLECLRRLHRYDPQPDETGRPTRPLENFFYVIARNFFVRLKRDRLRRTDSPCRVCHESSGPRSQHDDGLYCRKYTAWRRRNDAKANLMRPLDLTNISDTNEPRTRSASHIEDEAEYRELLSLIDERLDVDLRATYLQMRAGKAVPKARREAVEDAVRGILLGLEEPAA